MADFEQMWRELAPIGRDAGSGGYFRQPWTPAEGELRAWFAEAAAQRGLVVEQDAFGNLVAWWQPPGAAGSALLTGSHLDSVLDGGGYDGPLGVVSAFAAIDVLRARGFSPNRRIGVAAFAEEEGSRFGRACLGSRLAVGATTWAQARELTDRAGVRLGDVIEGADAPSGLLTGVDTYVELHVEQGRALVDREAAVGVASQIWPHGRYRFDFTGRADHAGTTRMGDRVDPMLTYAATALAAAEAATASAQRATFGRLEVRPNGTNAVPSQVTAWLDARAESPDHLSALVAAIEQSAAARAERDGTRLGFTAESVSGAVTFEPGLAEQLSRLLGSPAGPTAAGPTAGGAPILPTQAGHDAGILAEAGIRSAMLFVRNPTGVSHSPEEFAPMADCLAGVTALADVLAALTTTAAQPEAAGR